MDTERLIEGYPRYLGLALKLLGNEEDAKDIVQDAVLACLESNKQVKDPSYYCLRAVRNRCLMLLRKRNTLTPFEVSEVWNLTNRESVQRATLEDKLELLRYLKDKLSPYDRSIVELYFEDGRTMKQIAELTGKSEAKIGRTIARVKKILKAGLTSG